MRPCEIFAVEGCVGDGVDTCTVSPLSARVFTDSRFFSSLVCMLRRAMRLCERVLGWLQLPCVCVYAQCVMQSLRNCELFEA
jgi:hypothetical protein